MNIEYKKKWENLLNLTDELLLEIKKKKAQAEIKINICNGFATNIRMGKIETLEYNNNKQLIINIYKNKSKSIITTSDFTKKSLKNLINLGINITKYTEKDEYEELSNSKINNLNYDLDIYHPYKNVLHSFIQYGIECEQSAFSYNKKIINSDGCFFSTKNNYKIYSNTNGFIGAYPESLFFLSCNTISSNKKVMENDYKYIKIRDIKDLKNTKNIGILAAKNAINKLESRKIKTSKNPIILGSNIAYLFFNNFIKAINGNNIYNKKSFLLNSLDKKIFPEKINIYEEPHIKKAIGSKPFDDEGINTQFKIIINKGYLKNYLLDNYYAKKLKMISTGNSGGISNIIIKNDKISLKNLIKQMHKGLLITELLGDGTNIVTGNFSYGVCGFWVNKGIIEYPVNEITIAGNLKDIFLNIINISDDINHYEKIKTGSILIKNVQISGI